MPRRRGISGPPRDHLVAGEWPSGESDGPAAIAQAVARALLAALDGRSIREVARQADLQHATVLGLVNGTRWPDFVTLVKLEDALRTDLWPQRFDG